MAIVSSENMIIRPVQVADILTITRMAYDNMTGTDQQFTAMMRHPLSRMLSRITLPIYFLLAGQGYKAEQGGQIVGCAYLYFRKRSGYIFNVSVNWPNRRQGIGQKLLRHLENIILSQGRSWSVLQVDESNLPARKLYQQFGFQDYHPKFFHLDIEDFNPQASLTGLSVQPLIRFEGRRLYRQYRAIERGNGDTWAASVVGEYDLGGSSGGEYLRCLRDQENIGIGQITHKSTKLKINFAFEPAVWGEKLIGGLVQLILEENKGNHSQVELQLGSSEHHKLTTPILEGMGFKERFHNRILMLKKLA